MGQFYTALTVLLCVMSAMSAVPRTMIPDSPTYYMPMMPQYGDSSHSGSGGGGGGGFVVSSYVPEYATYHIVTPVRRPSPPTSSSSSAGYDSHQSQQQNYPQQSKYEVEEPKYYYGGKFKGTCHYDGLYYKDEETFVICSNGFATEQPCPPGTRTDVLPSYQPGYYYGASDLCSVNLVDFGYGPYSYIAQILSRYGTQKTDDPYTDSLVETVGSYADKTTGYEAPRKDTYDSVDNDDDDYPSRSITYPVSGAAGYPPARPPYPPAVAVDSHPSPTYNRGSSSSDSKPYAAHTPQSPATVSRSYASPAAAETPYDESPSRAAESYPPRSSSGYDEPRDSYQPANPYLPSASPAYGSTGGSSDSKPSQYHQPSYNPAPASGHAGYTQPKLTYASSDRKY